jgi:hypothetical protein
VYYERATSVPRAAEGSEPLESSRVHDAAKESRGDLPEVERSADAGGRRFDRAVLVWIHAYSPEWLEASMRLVTTLGYYWVVLPLLAAVVSLHPDEHREARDVEPEHQHHDRPELPVDLVVAGDIGDVEVQRHAGGEHQHRGREPARRDPPEGQLGATGRLFQLSAFITSG